MEKILRPGVALFQRFTMPTKLLAVALLSLIPFIFIDFWALKQIHADYSLLLERQDLAASSFVTIAVVTTADFLLLVYALLCLSIGTKRSFVSIEHAMELSTQGDMCVHIATEGSDELARLGQKFETMVMRISEMVADARSASAIVTHVGRQLVEDGSALSARTQSQAASLEETTANVGAVSHAVAQNSEIALEVSLMTKNLQLEAELSSSRMHSTVQGVGDLQATSVRMTEIIGTIDGIAFQTNILALNAAVEAARAGPQGRAFAVVASEVRSLASRSQKAASEVRTLIAESSAKVTQTVVEISRTSKLMESLAAGIREVAMIVGSIADGSAKQSTALDEVVQAIGDLDRVTIENSALVDRTSHRSNQLVERSRQLEQAVQHMILRQGTADEAMALVERAKAHIAKVGVNQALKDFQSPHGGFLDRDLYIFVLDRDGVYRVMGADALKVGTHLSETPGVDAQQLIDDAWARARKGGGWVEYNIHNLATGDVRGKSSFILPIDEGQLMGCGAYRSALR